MTCSKCGMQNTDDNRFCTGCGNDLSAQDAANEAAEEAVEAAVEETPAAEVSVNEEKKACSLKKCLANKKLIGIAAAVLAVIVILSVIICACCSGSDEFVKGDFSVIYDEEAEESHIIYAGEVIEKGLSGKISLKECASGEAAFYLDEEKTLYVVTEDGSKKVADEVTGLKGFSKDGENIVYADADYASVIHNVKSGDKKVFMDFAVDGVVFSSDNETFGYYVYDVDSDDEGENLESVIRCYVYADGESKKVFEGGNIIAISDNGKYIYCLKTDEETSTKELYVTNLKGEKTKIAADVTTQFTNDDCTQVVFRSDNKWYASVKGGEKIRIEGISSSVSTLYPIAEIYDDFRDLMFVGVSDDFEISVYKLNSKWTAEKLAGGIEDIGVSDDGETIYYLKNEKLYILGEDEAIEDEVKSFAVTHDGSAVYFISEDDTLYFKKGTKDKKRVADDIIKVYITHDDYALFADEDATLYSSDNGGAPKALCDDVKRVYTFLDYTYYYGDLDSSTDTVNVYIASKKTKFEKIFTDIKA